MNKTTLTPGLRGRKRLLSGAAAMLLAVSSPAVYADAAEAPSNEELYRMIQELSTNQDALREEARKAKAEAAAAKAELAALKSVGAAAGPATVTVPQGQAGMTASVEAIYLRPSRSNLDFAIEAPTAAGVQGNVVGVDPDYDLGGRLGLNWANGSGNDIGLQVTWLDASDSASASAPAGGVLFGTRLHPNSILDETSPTSASADYDFDHTAVDLSVGQRINVGSNLNLRLFGGLRYASLEQDFDIFYTNGVNTVNISEQNDFDGIGPRVGLEGRWGFGQGFSIFGEAAGSVLVGDFDLSYTDIENGGASTRVNIDESFDNRVVPVVEGRVGIAYNAKLASERSFGVSLGYEWQNWYNVVSVDRFSDDVDRQLLSTDTTDIGLDGFFLKGQLTF